MELLLVAGWSLFRRCLVGQDHAKDYSEWMELAARVSKETDPEKLRRVLDELCRALNEREKTADAPAGSKPQAGT